LRGKWISISCETAEYAGHKRYAIFGVLVFPIGIVVFFTVLVGRNRHKLPPDWWPVKAPEKQATAYEAYIAEGRVGDWQAHVDEEGRTFFWSDTLQQSSWEDPAAAETDATPAKPFAAWLAEIWDPQMLKYDKLYKRVGFLTSTYTQRYWWFESLVTVYKLAMTVLVMFVSDGDENKILFGMLIATAMMAFFSFYQPFRHRDILSINTGAQLVVLLVLFAAMFLLLNGGGSTFVAFTLVCLTLAPLAAGVVLTVRLPEDAIVHGAGDALTQDLTKAISSKFSAAKLSSMMGSSVSKMSFRLKSMSKGRHSKAVVSDAGHFSEANPMHRESSL
jgi:hypothetical protein